MAIGSRPEGGTCRQETGKFNYVTDINLPLRSGTEVNEIMTEEGLCW